LTAIWFRNNRLEIALALLALALYVPGIGWGLPYANDALRIRGWATDAITPLGPLTEIHGILVGYDETAYLGYPLLHYFVLAAVYAPVLAVLWLSGEFARPSAMYPFGFGDAVFALQLLEIVARLVTAGMAAVTVVATYRVGRILWNRPTGLLAALFLMLSYPMFYYSRTGNLDVPVLMWTSLGLVVFAKVLALGLTLRRAVWLGILGALAVATKEQAWGAFILLPIPVIVRHVRNTDFHASGQLLRLGFAALAAAIVTYALASGLAAAPARHLAHLRWMLSDEAFSLQQTVPRSLAGYAAIVAMTMEYLWQATGPTLLFAAVGLIMIATREPSKLAVAVPAAGHVLLVLMPVGFALLRYVMPIMLIVCVLAARAVAANLSVRGWGRAFAGAAVAATLGWNLVLGYDLTYQMWHDSRYSAAAWLRENLHPGDRLGHVVSPSSLPEIDSAIAYVLIPQRPNAAEEIARHQPDAIVLMPDWTTPRGGTRPATFPEDAERRLVNGSLGYRLAAKFKTRSIVNSDKLDYPTVNPPIQIFVRTHR
jgi:4-amino-4-deoxy-L-arabinose transferase-like glycosyltransferase